MRRYWICTNLEFFKFHFPDYEKMFFTKVSVCQSFFNWSVDLKKKFPPWTA